MCRRTLQSSGRLRASAAHFHVMRRSAVFAAWGATNITRLGQVLHSNNNVPFRRFVLLALDLVSYPLGVFPDTTAMPVARASRPELETGSFTSFLRSAHVSPFVPRRITRRSTRTFAAGAARPVTLVVMPHRRPASVLQTDAASPRPEACECLTSTVRGILHE